MFNWIREKFNKERTIVYTTVFRNLIEHISLERMNDFLKERNYSLVLIVNTDYTLMFEGKEILEYNQMIAREAHMIRTNRNYISEDDAEKIGILMVDLLFNEFSKEVIQKTQEAKEKSLTKHERQIKEEKEFRERMFKELKIK